MSNTAITTQETPELVQQILTELDAAYRMLPAEQQVIVHDALTLVFQGITALSERQGNYEAALESASALIVAQQAAITEMTNQRDLIADEHAKLARAMAQMDLNNPAIQRFWGKVYENAMENHNAAFWERTPYDMAQTLGDDWNHMTADKLYMLITEDEEESEYDPEQLRAWRSKLLALVQEFKDEE